TGRRPRPSAIPPARPNTRLSELAATATPARFARSSTGCSTSLAPCLKIELCSTLPTRRRKPRRGDWQAPCAGEELSHSCLSSPLRLGSKPRPGGRPCQGRKPPKAVAKPAFTGPAPPGPHSAARLDEQRHPNRWQKIWREARKNTCKNVGSPRRVHAATARWRDRLPEQSADLRPSVQGVLGDPPGDRRRSQAAARQNRLHLRAAHLGERNDASPARAHDCSRRRHLA